VHSVVESEAQGLGF